MMIREAKTVDVEEIWPISHKIAFLGDTYAYERDMSREDADTMWMKLQCM